MKAPTMKNAKARPHFDRLAVIASIALAGAASMATSPPDTGVPSVSVTVDAPIPRIELTNDRPEVAIAIERTGASLATNGRFVADLALNAPQPLEVVATLEGSEPGDADFVSRPIAGSGSLSIDRFLESRGVLRIRKLGAGSVTIGGRASFMTSVPEGTDTSSSSISLDLSIE